MDTSFGDAFSLMPIPGTLAFASVWVWRVVHSYFSLSFTYSRHVMIFIPHVTMLYFALMPVFMISYPTLSFPISPFLYRDCFSFLFFCSLYYRCTLLLHDISYTNLACGVSRSGQLFDGLIRRGLPVRPIECPFVLRFYGMFMDAFPMALTQTLRHYPAASGIIEPVKKGQTT